MIACFLSRIKFCYQLFRFFVIKLISNHTFKCNQYFWVFLWNIVIYVYINIFFNSRIIIKCLENREDRLGYVNYNKNNVSNVYSLSFGHDLDLQ